MMTQKDKELLLKDLCARLPYGVMIREDTVIYDDKNTTNYRVKKFNYELIGKGFSRIKGFTHDYEYIYRPYLFPLSSMTEEQLIELKTFTDLRYEHNTLELVEWNDNYKTLEFWLEEIPSYCVIEVFDWLNKNHFDYRGLIERGLANDATGLNIY